MYIQFVYNLDNFLRDFTCFRSGRCSRRATSSATLRPSLSASSPISASSPAEQPATSGAPPPRKQKQSERRAPPAPKARRHYRRNRHGKRAFSAPGRCPRPPVLIDTACGAAAQAPRRHGSFAPPRPFFAGPQPYTRGARPVFTAILAANFSRGAPRPTAAPRLFAFRPARQMVGFSRNIFSPAL